MWLVKREAAECVLQGEREVGCGLRCAGGETGLATGPGGDTQQGCYGSGTGGGLLQVWNAGLPVWGLRGSLVLRFLTALLGLRVAASLLQQGSCLWRTEDLLRPSHSVLWPP